MKEQLEKALWERVKSTYPSGTSKHTNALLEEDFNDFICYAFCLRVDTAKQSEISKLNQEVEQLRQTIQVNGVVSNSGEQKELLDKQDKIVQLSKEIEFTQKVADEIANSGELYVYKSNGHVKDIIQEYMKKNGIKAIDLGDEDVKKIVDMFSEKAKEGKIDKYTSASEVKKQFEKKKQAKEKNKDGLNKKEMVGSSTMNTTLVPLL